MVTFMFRDFFIPETIKIITSMRFCQLKTIQRMSQGYTALQNTYRCWWKTVEPSLTRFGLGLNKVKQDWEILSCSYALGILKKQRTQCEKLNLNPRFSVRDNFVCLPPQPFLGHLTVSEDSFDCHNLGSIEVTIAFGGQSLLNILQSTGQAPTTKNVCPKCQWCWDGEILV